MKVEFNLDMNFIDVWNFKEQKWDRYVKCNDEVEIIEEYKEDNKIDCDSKDVVYNTINELIKKVDKLIDEVNKL